LTNLFIVISFAPNTENAYRKETSVLTVGKVGNEEVPSAEFGGSKESGDSFCNNIYTEIKLISNIKS
jgi:hypothetical protein